MDKNTSLSGGAYIPPAKLKQLQASITDKSSVEYQRLAWEALKKSIHGLINKVNIPNIAQVVRELFKENVIRGRGLLVKSVLQAQQFSPVFTNVYAALISILNTKFPQIGELVLKRLLIQFKTTYRQNRKELCLNTCRFIAHLINQNVSHEILALQILTLLLENPTNHSVEVAIALLKDCGKKLQQESPKSLHAIFETLRAILHQSDIDMRIQYMIEVMFAIRKDDFKEYPICVKELDLVEENDQYTHLISIEDTDLDAQNELNIFKYDDNYLENENKYKILKHEILDESDSDDDDQDGDNDDGNSGEEESSDEEDKSTEAAGDSKKETIIDETETNLVSLRRTIYLTIQSSLDFQECAHKLLKMNIKKSQEIELCQMILDSCAQQRTYERFFGLLAQRFCQLRKEYVEYFEKIFKEQYETVHRLETVKLRNVSKLFAHLLYTDSISWGVLECIHLNEDETTSSSRVYIKNLFLELAENMGTIKLKQRLQDATLQEFFKDLFPRDNPRNTRFSINFFTSIGLGILTDDLREHLKSLPKIIATKPVVLDEISEDLSKENIKKVIKKEPKEEKVSKRDMNKKKKSKSPSSSSSTSSSSDSSSSDSSSSSSTDSSSDEDENKDEKLDRKKLKSTIMKPVEKAQEVEYDKIDKKKKDNKDHHEKRDKYDKEERHTGNIKKTSKRKPNDKGYDDNGGTSNSDNENKIGFKYEKKSKKEYQNKYDEYESNKNKTKRK